MEEFLDAKLRRALREKEHPSDGVDGAGGDAAAPSLTEYLSGPLTPSRRRAVLDMLATISAVHPGIVRGVVQERQQLGQILHARRVGDGTTGAPDAYLASADGPSAVHPDSAASARWQKHRHVSATEQMVRNFLRTAARSINDRLCRIVTVPTGCATGLDNAGGGAVNVVYTAGIVSGRPIAARSAGLASSPLIAHRMQVGFVLVLDAIGQLSSHLRIPVHDTQVTYFNDIASSVCQTLNDRPEAFCSTFETLLWRIPQSLGLVSARA